MPREPEQLASASGLVMLCHSLLLLVAPPNLLSTSGIKEAETRGTGPRQLEAASVQWNRKVLTST
jgi:hypothetical protein